MSAMIPISVFIRGVGTIYFPYALRGKIVSEAEYKAIWAKYVTTRLPQPMTMTDD